MKAVQYAEYGGPEVLHVVEVDEPHPGPGQVRIVVHAAGVNGLDWKARSGMFADGVALAQPRGTGIDAAGVVDELGEGVSGVAVGDAVMGQGSGTYAESAVLDGWGPKPDAMSFAEAAGYPVAVETAARIMEQVGIRPGQTLLVSGASGGVGSAVLQLARARGIMTVATAGAANQDYLRSLGAVATTYGDGLVARVRDLAPSIDAALDIAGSGVIAELIELTGDATMVLSIADFSAPALGAQVSSTGTHLAEALAEATELYADGAFTLPVEHTFTLATAGAAQELSAGGHARGRIVITVGPTTKSARTA